MPPTTGDNPVGSIRGAAPTVLHPTNRIRMANNDLRSAGAVWRGFLARYLLNLDIATPTKLSRTISATDNNRFIFSFVRKWYCFQCVYVLCSLKTSLVDKDFFNHFYSSHLTLPVYTSSSFLGSLGSLIELVKKKRGPSLQIPWEAVPAERTMHSKLYRTEKVSPLCGNIPQCGVSQFNPNICLCQFKSEIMKIIFYLPF